MCCHRESSTVGRNMTTGAVMVTECDPQIVRSREGPIALDDHDVLMAHIRNTGMSDVSVKCAELPPALCTRGRTTA